MKNRVATKIKKLNIESEKNTSNATTSDIVKGTNYTKKTEIKGSRIKYKQCFGKKEKQKESIKNQKQQNGINVYFSGF